MLYNITYQNAVYERFNPVGKIARHSKYCTIYCQKYTSADCFGDFAYWKILETPEDSDLKSNRKKGGISIYHDL